MNRIRCVPLLAFLHVPITRMAEVILRRECEAPLVDLIAGQDKETRTQWRKETVPQILGAAGVILGRAVSRGDPLHSVLPENIAALVAWVPSPGDLADRVVEVVGLICLERVRAEAERRIDRRKILPKFELKVGLIPFTMRCGNESLRARECWCGCWIEETALEKALRLARESHYSEASQALQGVQEPKVQGQGIVFHRVRAAIASGLGKPTGEDREMKAALAIARNDAALLPAAGADFAADQLDAALHGDVTCPFCGDPRPETETKRVWRRTRALEDQLELHMERRREFEERVEELRDQDIRIPNGCDPDAYNAQIGAGMIPEVGGGGYDERK